MMLSVRPTFLATALLTALLAAGLLTAAPASSHPDLAPQPRTTDTARVEARLLDQVNGARRRAGCRPLRPRAALHGAAGAHSVAMADGDTLSHQLPGEAALRDRIAAAGYRHAARTGEVIARGSMSAREVLRRWLASPPHRALLLDCRLRLAGLGVRDRDGDLWWTIDLVRR